MTIMIEDGPTEHMAQNLTSAQGTSAGNVVRESVLALAQIRGLVLDQPPLHERLAKLALDIAALPKAAPNPLTDDAVLGYDEQGIW
jgi:hypothetical protein